MFRFLLVAYRYSHCGRSASGGSGVPGTRVSYTSNIQTDHERHLGLVLFDRQAVKLPVDVGRSIPDYNLNVTQLHWIPS